MNFEKKRMKKGLHKKIYILVTAHSSIKLKGHIVAKIMK